MSKNLLFTIAAVVAASCCLTATPSLAEIVFQEDFSGTGSPLNGTTPDISTTGAMWEAADGFLDDGTANNVGQGSQAAHLDLALEAGKKYIAEATILNDQFDWIGFGFTVNDRPDWTAINDSNNRHSNGAGGAVWLLTRNRDDANNQEGFKGAGTAGPQAWNGNVVDPTQPIDIKLILDNTGLESVGSFFLNGALQSTTVFSSLVVKPIGIDDGGAGGGIGFSHTADSDGLGGVISNFTLTVVPEPTSLALVLLSGMSLAVVRKR